jgi:hypothetical protein
VPATQPLVSGLRSNPVPTGIVPAPPAPAIAIADPPAPACDAAGVPPVPTPGVPPWPVPPVPCAVWPLPPAPAVAPPGGPGKMLGGGGAPPPSAGAEHPCICSPVTASPATPNRIENRLVMFIASLPFVLKPRVCRVIAIGKEVTRGRGCLDPMRVWNYPSHQAVLTRQYSQQISRERAQIGARCCGPPGSGLASSISSEKGRCRSERAILRIA